MSRKSNNVRSVKTVMNGYFTQCCKAIECSDKKVKVDENFGCLDHCYPIECPYPTRDMIGDVDIEIFQRSVVTLGPGLNGNSMKSLCFNTQEMLPTEPPRLIFNPNAAIACLGPDLCDSKKVVLSPCDWTIAFWAKLKKNVQEEPECDMVYILFSQDKYDETEQKVVDDLKLVVKYDFGEQKWAICLTVYDEEFCELLENFNPCGSNHYAIVYSKNKEQVKVYINGMIELCADKKYKHRNTCFCLGWFSESVAQHLGDQLFDVVQEGEALMLPWNGYIDKLYIFPYQLSENSINDLICENKITLTTCCCEWVFECNNCETALIKSITIPLCMNICSNICDLAGCECIKVTIIKDNVPNTIINIKSINEWPCTITIAKDEDGGDKVRLVLDFNKLFCKPLSLECGDSIEVCVDTGAFIKKLNPIIITGCIVP